MPKPFLLWFFFFWCDWGLNSGLCTCKVAFYCLSPRLQFILFGYFGVGGLVNYLLSLDLELQTPDLSLSGN
jgi:hypothetical protein